MTKRQQIEEQLELFIESWRISEKDKQRRKDKHLKYLGLEPNKTSGRC